ncbi:MAG: AzlD domain-containing protein [Chloroflexota bacterium]
MTIWLVVIIGGLITFGIRFSLIYLLGEGKFEIPETLRKALHYVPPAVLSAIIFPELFIRDGNFDLALTNTRLLAGILAVVTAWFSRNTLLTILVGMAALFLLQWLV